MRGLGGAPLGFQLPALSDLQHAVRMATTPPITKPNDFQNPATGRPARTESTAPRAKPCRHPTHSTGRVKGIPATESTVTMSACH